MSSTDLVPIDTQLEESASRIPALVALNEAAEQAASAHEAQEVMLKAKVISRALVGIKAPFEEARLAGKASVLAARRLGRILAGMSHKPVQQSGRGTSPSERGLAMRELGLSYSGMRDLIRLSNVDDPEFQRYIQKTDQIPSVRGAQIACRVKPPRQPKAAGWHSARRLKVGVKTPRNPSIDEGYSLVVRALGHLSGVRGNVEAKAALGTAMEHLYAAEDLIKPHRANGGGLAPRD